MSVDRVDVAILRAMIHDPVGQCFQTNFALSLGKIASQIRASPAVVTRRLAALRGSGFLRGIRLGLNPRILNQGSSMVYFESANIASRDRIVESAKRLSGLFVVARYFGNAGAFICAHPQEYLSESAVLHRLPELKEARLVRIIGHRFYAPRGIPSPTDWTIVRSLGEPGRWTCATVGKRLGLPGRTVRQRLERMVRGHLFFVLPDLDLDALEGGILVTLAAFFADANAKASFEMRMLPLLNDYYFLTPSAEPTFVPYFCIFPNLTRAEALRRMGRSLPGVKSLWLLPYLSIENRLPLLASVVREEGTTEGTAEMVTSQPLRLPTLPGAPARWFPNPERP